MVYGFGSSLFYNTVFLVFALIYLPRFILKSKAEPDPGRLIRERLGMFSGAWIQKVSQKSVVWIHAVSVGEVLAVEKFLKEFLARASAVHIVLTTVTPTGQRLAKKWEGERVSVCYFPFDLTGPIRNFFKVLRPQALFLVETEIWPNLLKEAGRAGVPVGILNARISPRSERRYLALKNIFRPLFSRLDFVLAQTEEDALRFVRLGVEAGRVHYLGNMKFDNVSLNGIDFSLPSRLRRQWNFAPEDRILIAGSTHPGEEGPLVRVFLKLRDKFPGIKMILAPRHIERCEALARKISRQNLRVQFSTLRHEGGDFDVLLLNELGMLKDLYGLADLVFMGGSLVPRGGQNPIEPASFKRPILHGPHVFNFHKIYQLLDLEGGAILVRDEEQILFALARLIPNEKECQWLGENAFALVQKLQGATQRHLEWVTNFLSQSPEERINDVVFHAKLFPSAGGRV